MATKKGKEKTTPKPSARKGIKRALAAEPPVHLYISACTEDGAIFKCGEVDTDFQGLVTFFSTPIFYFLCLFIIAFAYLIACLFDFMHLVTTWLK